ncbi:MAG: hypothetical protein ABI813_10165 [Bacteroidota bacterium]
MSARTFISLMLLLLVFTGSLLVFASPGKQKAQKAEYPAGFSGNNNNSDEQARAAEGSMLWESVSRHLLSAVQ